MLRLILGRAGTGKTGQIMGEIRSRVEARQGASILIVPEQYSHEAERELARQCGDTLSLYAEVLSFTRLAARRRRRPEGAPGNMWTPEGTAFSGWPWPWTRWAGAWRSMARPAASRRAWDAFNGPGRAPGQPGRPGGSAPGSQPRAGAVLGAKLRDLALIQEAMDALEARSGTDPASRMDILAQDVPRCSFLQGAQVYVDGFTDFTAQERRVLRELWLAAGM